MKKIGTVYYVERDQDTETVTEFMTRLLNDAKTIDGTIDRCELSIGGYDDVIDDELIGAEISVMERVSRGTDEFEKLLWKCPTCEGVKSCEKDNCRYKNEVSARLNTCWSCGGHYTCSVNGCNKFPGTLSSDHRSNRPPD